MRLRFVFPLFAGVGLSCGGRTDPPKGELDIYDIVPGNGELTEADGDGGDSTPSYLWEGPEIAPIDGRAWGGLSTVLPDRGCHLWWSLEGDAVPCDSCDLAFELIADLIDEDCGVGAEATAFQLEFTGGRTYGFGRYWGAAESGGGLVSWDGYSDYGYRYYGFIRYP